VTQARIRIAAVGDIHLGVDCHGRLGPGLAGLEQQADALLLAGDLTKCGTVEEGRVVVSELQAVEVPVIAVLGNHDHHDGRPEAIVDILAESGIRVLEGHAIALDLPGGRLGVAGVKGFGGGFPGGHASAFGEPEMKAFANHTYAVSERLATALTDLDGLECDARVALLHYSPIADTLAGERLELYPFLGSGLLADAVDRSPVDLVLHGHAHFGVEEGRTPGGIPVRNVAMPVIGDAYRVFELAVPARLADAAR
jgi:Icc-related predicted phosphoesterase